MIGHILCLLGFHDWKIVKFGLHEDGWQRVYCRRHDCTATRMEQVKWGKLTRIKEDES